jgi:hypothetical protein
MDLRAAVTADGSVIHMDGAAELSERVDDRMNDVAAEKRNISRT